MKNGKFGTAIIGCGSVSPSHARAYKSLSNQCELIAVCDTFETSAKKLMAEYQVETYYQDYHKLLEDERIDVVSICLPHYLHALVSIAAAKAKKHMIVEKPMAMNVGEADQMIKIAKQNGVKLTVGSERINPRHRFIHDQVLPELGKVRFSHLMDFYFRDTAYYSRGAWRGTWSQEGGGIFVNQAIYTWDQWQWYLGGVEYAYGYWTNILHPTIEVEDIGYGLVHFKDGTHGKFFATSAFEAPENMQGMRIYGENGQIHSDGAWLYTLDFSLNDKKLENALRADFNKVIDPEYKGYYQPWQARDLFDAIKNDREPLVTGETAKEALKILNGIHWHGWNQADKFKGWIRANHELPKPSRADGIPTVDEAKAQNWRGGSLIKELERIVKNRDPVLEAPFI